MARKSVQELARAAWSLAKQQHWVITRRQLLDLGYTREAIDVRLEDGRLHRVFAGVYAVGRPHLTREGYFMAAVLACGPGAALSHFSAAELYGILKRRPGPVHVSVPYARAPRIPGIKAHRRVALDVRVQNGIPTTSPICTLIDLAQGLDEPRLERAINEAVNRDLVELDNLRASARGRASAIARLLDRAAYVVTDTRLEQRFLRIVRRTGLPLPQTQRRLAGGRVDFYWPGLGLVVEADSLRFHRTPAQQAADVLRDQKHAAAELTPLRFTHWQITFDPDHVAAVLTAVARRLAVAA
jgi:predicted transcriptional regulator of viral defense system